MDSNFQFRASQALALAVVHATADEAAETASMTSAKFTLMALLQGLEAYTDLRKFLDTSASYLRPRQQAAAMERTKPEPSRPRRASGS